MHLPNIALKVGAIKAPIILEKSEAMTMAYMLSRGGEHMRFMGKLPQEVRNVIIPQELQTFIKRAEDRGQIRASMIEELSGASRMGGGLLAPRTTEATVNVVRAIKDVFGKETNLAKTKESVQTAIRNAEIFSSLTGEVTEKKNRVQGFIQGYLIGKEQNLKGEDLYKFAEDWTRFVNIDYTKANLPIIFSQIKSGPVRGVARAFYMYQSIVSAMMHMMSNTWRSTAPVTSKLAATGYGATSFILLSGIYGLPFAMMARWLSGILFGDDDPAKAITKNPKIPEVIRTIADGGLPALAGVDLRRSIGGGDWNPFDLTARTPFSVVQGVKNAAEDIRRKEWTRLASRIPIGLPPPVRAQFKGEEQETYGAPYGARVLIPAQDLTPWEKTVTRMGLTPWRVGELRETQYEMMKKNEDRSSTLDELADKFARALQANDDKKMNEAIDELVQYNTKADPALQISDDSFNQAIELRFERMQLGEPLSEPDRQKLLRESIEEPQP